MPRPRYGLSVCLLICLTMCAPLRAQSFGVALQVATTFSEPFAPDAQTTARPSFHPADMGELEDADGLMFSFTGWVASGGIIHITTIHRNFGQPEIARAYFESRLAKAVKVIARSDRRDGSGKVVAWRAEILSHADEGVVWAIVLASADDYREILSRSMHDNRAFEKFLTH